MGLDNMTNGKLSNNFVQGAVRWVDGFKALGWVLGIIFGFLLIVTEWVIVPQLEKKIESAARAAAKPLDDRLIIMEKLYATHLLDVA